MSSTHLEIRNVVVWWAGISEDSVDTLTNKTLDSYTNYIHADWIHYRVKATENIAYGDRLSFVWFNAGEQAIEVKVRDTLSEPVIAVSHETMTTWDFGMAVFNGLFKNIDTSAFSEWAILYDNASGWFTTTPTINDTNYNQAIAYVVRSHATNGEIMLNIGHWHERASQISYGTGSVKDKLDTLGTMAEEDVVNFDTSTEVDTKISTAISNLVDTAPWALDTLNELANALGDDPNFATTMTTALGNKVDKIAGKGLSQEDYTTAEKSKLAGISAGAEVNVNADWNSVSGDSQILNKPTLGTSSSLDIAPTGNASATQVVKGDDTRLSDARTPTAHTHTTSDITNLSSYTGFDARYYTETETNTLLSGKANTSHTHTLSQVTDVTMTVANLNTLDDWVNSTLHFHDSDRNRANHTGTQAISTVTGLQTALDNKLDDSQASVFGLSLLDDADASTARTTLGLWTLATQSGTFSGTSSGTNTGDNAVNSLYSGLVSNATHTGEVTGATALTITADAVTNTKLANMAVNTIKWRITAGTGDPEDLTATQVRTITETETTTQLNTRDTNNRARANHTGTQTASTISDFNESVEDIIWTKIVAWTNVTISYNDTTWETTIDSSWGGGGWLTYSQILSITNFA